MQRVSDSLKERSYFRDDQFASTQVKYLQVKARLKERIRTLSAAAAATHRNAGTGSGNLNGSAPTINNSSLQASLEKLRLPRFDGKQRDWEAFKEKFSSLIISDQVMSSIIKFQHLFNCLDGEAAEKLKGIKVTGDNFETAWETLCKRYDNKYLRFSLQMQTLVNLPSASNESVWHLSQLLNTVNESINTFTNLQRPVEKWDDILIYFLESKLAVTTRMDWTKEVERKAPSTFPKFADIKTFIEDRITTLDFVNGETMPTYFTEDSSSSSQRNSSTQPNKDSRRKPFSRKSHSASVNVATQRSGKPPYQGTCSYCSESHFVGYCTKFAACPQINEEHTRLRPSSVLIA